MVDFCCLPVTLSVRSMALVSLIALGGCGLFTPEKDLFTSDYHEPGLPSPRGLFENVIVAHVRCELRNSVMDVMAMNGGPAWIKDWGAQVTLKLTVEETSSANPGISFLTPLENSVKAFPVGGNVTSAQNVSIGVGVSGMAKATRLETIAFTFAFVDLLDEAKKDVAAGTGSCAPYETGTRLQSDLKIRQFIYDKAFIATTGEATTGNVKASPYSTFSEDITFVASYGGSVTPVWKFARIAVNGNSNMANALRTKTDDILITLSPATPATPKSAARLSTQGQIVHNAQVTAAFTASSIQSNTH
jgi:hypothetical protein